MYMCKCKLLSTVYVEFTEYLGDYTYFIMSSRVWPVTDKIYKHDDK